MNHAVTCGLIINELVSNALKHAFPGQRPGHVNIELSSLPAGRYNLIVSDDGVGIPEGIELERADTLGLQLVSDLAAQLNGSAQLHNARGTTFSIEFAAKGRDDRGRGQLLVR
jgi:two-component sensor histidine kinase